MRTAGYGVPEILEFGGFRASDFSFDYFAGCMKRWRKKERDEMSGKSRAKRGRPPGSKIKNYETLENLTMNDLKSIVLVQEEIIKELKKRKALADKKLGK
jgi:hypothetical protein